VCKGNCIFYYVKVCTEKKCKKTKKGENKGEKEEGGKTKQ
jgi:hypothetical protein